MLARDEGERGGIGRRGMLGWQQRDAQLPRSRLAVLHTLGLLLLRVQKCYTRNPGKKLLEHLQLLPWYLIVDVHGEARDVSSRPAEALHRSMFDGAHAVGHDDRNGPGYPLGGLRHRI